jgi:pantoate--beta-alanine ligase
METLTRSASIRDRVRAWRAAGRRIALVPTRGTLHKGHIRLVAEAQERADHVIVSRCANPPQLDAPMLEADRDLLSKIGPDLLFIPPIQEVFPAGSDSSALVTLPSFENVLEGAFRPAGYFGALSTVQVKLFNIVGPDVAVFGERDFQELVIVRRLVEELFLPIEIVGCPIMREGDGLALATANRDLTREERALAPRLYAALGQIGAQIGAGRRDYAALEREGSGSLEAAGFITDYFAIRQSADLAPVGTSARELVILAAARLPRSRLCDNLRVNLIERH